MRTTQGNAAVVRREAVGSIIGHIKESRKGVPRALNGRGIAPSDPRAAQLRKDLFSNGHLLVENILVLIECDVRDGAPASEATAWLRQVIAHAELVAAAELRVTRPLSMYVRDEARCRARLDIDELTLIEQQHNPAVLQRMVRDASAEIHSIDTLRSICEHELAALHIGLSARMSA